MCLRWHGLSGALTVAAGWRQVMGTVLPRFYKPWSASGAQFTLGKLV